MITFIILAAAFTFAAAIAIAIPLLKRDKESTHQASWTAMTVIGVLVVGGAATYVSLSNWPWSSAPQIEAAAQGPDSPLAMVERLKKKLEQNPQDLDGWLMLGRSYMALEQTPLAIRAYEHADRIAGGKNVEALVGLAEALAVQDQNALVGPAGELLEKALQIDPKSDRALFYGGAAALRRGDFAVARQRFATLLEMNPPEQIRGLLQEQVSALDAKLGGTSPLASANSAGAQGNAGATNNSASGTGISGGGLTAANGAGSQSGGVNAQVGATGAMNGAGVGNGPRVAAAGEPEQSGMTDSANSAGSTPAVHVTVNISPQLSASLPAGAPLFVFVRDPNRPGPPLAVKRLQNRFPQTVELTSADAMVPGLQLTAGQQVKVVARIAKSGTPVAQSGDPFGEVGYRIGHDKVVDVVIDRLTP